MQDVDRDDAQQTDDDANARKGPVTREEEQRLWDAFLVPDKQPSYLQLARDFGRNRETIAKHLNSPEFEQYRATQLEAARKRAVLRLSRGVEQAAGDWLDASTVAAAKGDHRPAKELMIATGAIAPDEPTHRLNFIVTNGHMPNGQALPDPFSMVYDAASRSYCLPEKGTTANDAPPVG